MTQGHHKWCKFEMDAVEYYEGSQMKTKFTVKGKFLKNALVFVRSYTGIIFSRYFYGFHALFT